MSKRERHPWDRRKNESAKVFSYFQVYLHLGPNDRSYGKTAVEVGCSISNIEKIAARWTWTERVDAWDRCQDELNFARFDRMREKAAQRRMERELERQEDAAEVANLLLDRARKMLNWPIEQEIVTDKTTEITPDGQTLNITMRKTIKPVKWSMVAAMRVVEALDRMQRASVEDALKAQETAGIPAEQIAERHFTLHTAEQVQQPKAPDTSMDETPKDSDWTVDEGGEGVHRSLEPRILW